MYTHGMGTEHSREWGDGKPLLVVYVAQLVAAAANDLFAGMGLIRSGEVGQAFGSAPPVAQWLSFYRGHRGLQRVVLEALPLDVLGVRLTTETAEPLRKGCAELGRMTPEDLEVLVRQIPAEEWKQVAAKVQEQIGNATGRHFSELEQWMSGNPFSDEVLSRASLLPEVQFVVRVVWPCWIEFGDTAARLLFRARHAGREGAKFERERPWKALEQLVRLDKAILSETRIREAFNGAATARDIHFEDVAKAVAGSPNRKLTPGNLKAALGAFIQRASEVMNYPLSAAEIRRLYDALAKDRGTALRDADLPELDDAWIQAVLRARALWKPFFGPDKKR
jgi:hypothetical protein